MHIYVNGVSALCTLSYITNDDGDIPSHDSELYAPCFCDADPKDIEIHRSSVLLVFHDTISYNPTANNRDRDNFVTYITTQLNYIEISMMYTLSHILSTMMGIYLLTIVKCSMFL